MTSRLAHLTGALSILAACAGEPSAPEGQGGEAPLAICEAKPNHKPVSIFGGDRTMLAVMDDGTLYCWRENGTGQCDITEYGVLFDYPIRVPNLPCATKAAAGNVGIAMTADGRAFTWGVEVNDERGDGVGGPPPPTEPTQLALQGVTAVAGNHRAMGALAERQGFWWGELVPRASEPHPAGEATSASITIDASVSCLLSELGAVACWGRNLYGTLGPGQPDSERPVPIQLPHAARTVTAADNTVCALLLDGRVYCWGANFVGTLGRGVEGGVMPSDAAPVSIAADGVFAGATVADSTACAWRPSGEVFCWGDNYIGIYAPHDGAPRSLPRRVPELEPAKQVAVVYDEVCALGFDDVIRCRIPHIDPGGQEPARVLDFINPAPVPE